MNKGDEDLILEKSSMLNQHISDIQINLEEMKKDLSEMRSDLKSINISTTKTINNYAWIRNMSAVFIPVIAVLTAILMYQLVRLDLTMM